MWRVWIEKWLFPKPGHAESQASPTQIVPHTSWTDWLQRGCWDHAAECLETWANKAERPQPGELLTQWQNQLVTHFLESAWQNLDLENALRWVRRVDRLMDRKIMDQRLEDFRQVADLIWDTQRVGLQGDMREAIACLDSAANLCIKFNKPNCLQRINTYKKKYYEFQEVIVELNVCMRINCDEGDWNRAAITAHRILRLAPEHPGALAVLKRQATDSQLKSNSAINLSAINLNETVPHTPNSDAKIKPDSAQDKPELPPALLPKFTAKLFEVSMDRGETWLVTTAGRLEIGSQELGRINQLFGQGNTRATVILSRDEEGCWVGESRGELVHVNGKPAQDFALFQGVVLKFGSGPEFVFNQPRMETGSARLELVHGPTKQGVRGLLLVGSVLTIGAEEHAEVRHPEIEKPLILIQRHGSLFLKHDMTWTINGETCSGEVPFSLPCRMRIKNTGIYWEL